MVESGMVVNITNGEMMNQYFHRERGGVNFAFNEMMMHGRAVMEIGSAEFVALRAEDLGVAVSLYREKMQVLDWLFRHSKDGVKLALWFGKDSFCQLNLLTLLAYLEQIQWEGEIRLNIADDVTYEIISGDIPVLLGAYSALYRDVVVLHKSTPAVGVIDKRALELFFDYLSPDGALATLIRSHPDDSEDELICKLMEVSLDYGISDVQAAYLIEKYGKK